MNHLKITTRPRTFQESCVLNKTTQNLLLLGLPRTGTSLMYQLLNMHPDVFITYESLYNPIMELDNYEERHGYFYEILKNHFHLNTSLQEEAVGIRAKPMPFNRPYKYFGDKKIYPNSNEFAGRMQKTV